MCATNGEPIYNNFKLFAMKDKHIMISKLVDGNIQFVDPHDVIDEIRYIKTITSDEADFITVKNLKKVIDTYEENLKETNSYIMWSKIIANTFTRAWWDKNFKLKVSNDKK